MHAFIRVCIVHQSVSQMVRRIAGLCARKLFKSAAQPQPLARDCRCHICLGDQTDVAIRAQSELHNRYLDLQVLYQDHVFAS
jgi:hypothetical protein